MAFDANDPEDQKILQDAIAKAMEGAEAKKTELLGETKAEREKRRALESELEKLKASAGDIDAEEYKELKAAKEEQEKRDAEKKGEYAKLTAKQKEESDKKIAAAEGEATKLRTQLHEQITSTAILKALEAEKGNSALLSHVVKSHLKIEETDNGIQIIGLDKNGDPMVAEDGSVGNALDVVKYLKTQEAYQPAFDAHQMGGSGSQASKKLGGSGKNPWKNDSFNLTEQGNIIRSDPTLAATLKREAGVS